MNKRDENWSEYDTYLTKKGFSFTERMKTKEWYYKNHSINGRFIELKLNL